MENCIFCKIIAGEIPSKKVYEDEQVLAFDDIAPQAPVHTLVIPKRHVRNVLEGGEDAQMMAALMHGVAQVARIKGLDNGFRLIANTGKAAGQTVEHLHFHMLGGGDFSEKLI